MDASSSTFSAGSTTADSAVRREMAAASGRIARVKRIDRAAVGLITLGGVLVVVSVIGILVFIASEALPLFRSASATKIGTFTVGAAST
jgi:ABC-type phosphate transport system permease subunit